jgi:hypothetical protein
MEKPNRLLETNETDEETLLRLYALDSDSLFDFSKVEGKGKPVIYGGWEGKVKMAYDFNAPLDNFYELNLKEAKI